MAGWARQLPSFSFSFSSTLSSSEPAQFLSEILAVHSFVLHVVTNYNSIMSANGDQDGNLPYRRNLMVKTTGKLFSSICLDY